MITFGMDPEFLVQGSPGLYGGYATALDIRGVIEGTKELPVPIKGGEKGWTQQLDGLSIELGCPPIEFSVDGAVGLMDMAVEQASHINFSQVRPELGEKPLAINKDYMMLPEGLEKEDIPHGCDPDSNVYGVEKLELAGVCSGWHIHLGLELKIPEQVLINFLDACSNPWTVTGSRRDQAEGRLGTYRRTDYGIEYRTPGTPVYNHRREFIQSVDVALRMFDVVQNDPKKYFQWWKGGDWGRIGSYKNFTGNLPRELTDELEAIRKL